MLTKMFIIYFYYKYYYNIKKYEMSVNVDKILLFKSE